MVSSEERQIDVFVSEGQCRWMRNGRTSIHISETLSRALTNQEKAIENVHILIYLHETSQM